MSSVPISIAAGEKSSSLTNLALCGSVDNISNAAIGKRSVKRKVAESEFSMYRDEVKDMLINWKKGSDERDMVISKNIEDMNERISELLNTNNQLYKIIEKNSEEVKELKKRLISLSKEHTNKISFLEEQIEVLQRKDKENVMEITNIPANIDIDVFKTVENMHKSLNVDDKVKTEDVKRAFISKGVQKSTIVVEYYKSQQKLEVLKAARGLYKSEGKKLNTQTIGLEGLQRPIYISDALTPLTRKIYFHARNLKKSGVYKFCWISHGRVLLREADGKPAILVKTLKQIQDLGARLD